MATLLLASIGMKNMTRWFLFFWVISSTVFSQHAIEGVVIDKETGTPIPFVSIGVVGTSRGTTSNLVGQFSLIISDSASIKVTCVGYESQVLSSVEKMQLVKLRPIATQLNTILITNKPINPTKIVRKAFAKIGDNYDRESFLQKFFYRHYSLTNSVYEKLIEASVDVWRHEGYRDTRSSFGEKEAVRINQLRRSLDITEMVQAQKPLWLDNILQADMIGYQAAMKDAPPTLFEERSNLRTDFHNYRFTFDGITNYDGDEVYKIGYAHKQDSVKTTAGYKVLPKISGSLFITTDTYAFVKTEDVKHNEVNTIHTSAYYRKYGAKYYPYHFMREGENRFMDEKFRSFHIELMSVEIRHGETERFTGREPGREELLDIPYDSLFWDNSPILKATPLEEDIIHDLGGGISLNRQFYLYRQYELNVTDGGNNGEQKFSWFKDDSRGKRILYLCFWKGAFDSFSDLIELERIKRLNQVYKNKITFVLLSLDNDEETWKRLLTKYNLFADGIINYRIGSSSTVMEEYKIKGTPTFVILSKDGSVFDSNAKRPSDPLLEKDFKSLLEK